MTQAQVATAASSTVRLLSSGTQSAVRSGGTGEWGLARSVRAEAWVRLQCVDAASPTVCALRLADAEVEAVQCHQTLLAPRLKTAPPSLESLVRLHFHSRGAIDNLSIELQSPLLPHGDADVILHEELPNQDKSTQVKPSQQDVCRLQAQARQVNASCLT